MDRAIATVKRFGVYIQPSRKNGRGTHFERLVTRAARGAIVTPIDIEILVALVLQMDFAQEAACHDNTSRPCEILISTFIFRG